MSSIDRFDNIGGMPRDQPEVKRKKNPMQEKTGQLATSRIGTNVPENTKNTLKKAEKIEVTKPDVRRGAMKVGENVEYEEADVHIIRSQKEILGEMMSEAAEKSKKKEAEFKIIKDTLGSTQKAEEFRQIVHQTEIRARDARLAQDKPSTKKPDRPKLDITEDPDLDDLGESDFIEVPDDD